MRPPNSVTPQGVEHARPVEAETGEPADLSGRIPSVWYLSATPAPRGPWGGEVLLHLLDLAGFQRLARRGLARGAQRRQRAVVAGWCHATLLRPGFSRRPR